MAHISTEQHAENMSIVNIRRVVRYTKEFVCYERDWESFMGGVHYAVDRPHIAPAINDYLLAVRTKHHSDLPFWARTVISVPPSPPPNEDRGAILFGLVLRIMTLIGSRSEDVARDTQDRLRAYIAHFDPDVWRKLAEHDT